MSEEKNLMVNDFTNIKELSKIFYEAGIFDDVKSEAQAIVKIIAGREMGLTPMESMNGLIIVKGRVSPTTNIVSSKVKSSKEYDYKIEQLDNETCILVFTKNDIEIGKSEFTFKDAAKAGLVNKDNWKNYPRNMLFARALNNGVRWYCPHLYAGSCADELLDIDQPETKKEIIEITAEGELK